MNEPCEVYYQKVRRIIPSVFTPIRRKWFRGEGEHKHSSSIMCEAFGDTYVCYVVWDSIRILTNKICGEKYVRNAVDPEEIVEITDKLCQTVYDLRKEFIERMKEDEREKEST